ncbi:MAG TPA: S8 family serine peptidase [Pseudolabrys sp.]|nr:S8 family serine peptidase [Pseudolabrys sp.]
MRRIATVAFLAAAMVAGGPHQARAQVGPGPTPAGVAGSGITALGGVAIGAIAAGAAGPIIGTIVLGRELTPNEVYRFELSVFLGPVGWVLGPRLFPDTPGGGNQPSHNSRGPRSPRSNTAPARNINIPPPGAPFVPDEVLLEFDAGTSSQTIATLTGNLQLAPLETQTFPTTGRVLQRMRIIGSGTVRATLGRMRGAGFGQISAGQANFLYTAAQTQPPAAQSNAPNPSANPNATPSSSPSPSPDPEQYVVPKMHLLEAHRITNGDDVIVAVIDSKIDTQHPDLAGVFAGEFDALDNPNAPPHEHGTAMAGAIAAHAKLLGVSPKVKLLAVRAFAGEKESAQGTTFNILKGVQWAIGKGARIINMSFAGPPDPMLRNLLANAHLRGVVLIAAVGNAGPKSPPLYPAADPEVIGVTATDADDRLLKVANRGPQVAIAAPGVQILEPAPDGTYQVTTGTSVAAAHATGVAALLLARKPDLKPDEVRSLLERSARHIPGNKRDVGAGVIDALRAIDAINSN